MANMKGNILKLNNVWGYGGIKNDWRPPAEKKRSRVPAELIE